jgi:ribosome biogenesis GTPase
MMSREDLLHTTATRAGEGARQEREEHGLRMPDTQEGLVIARAHGYFVVRTEDGVARLCTIRGKLRRAHQLSRRTLTTARSHPAAHLAPVAPSEETPDTPPVMVAVGDHVRLQPDGPAGGTIEAIMPRRNKLARAAVESTQEQILLANLDLVILVFAVQEPTPHVGLLDRYLVLAEDAEIDAAICFNKIDLGIPDEVAEVIALYRGLGYPVIETSMVLNVGLTTLSERLANRVTLLTGPSGVGKSSLLNAIEPSAGQRIGEISVATGKGKHTTTGVQLFPLSAGGWLADSAGIRELAPWNIPRERLAEAFVEFRPLVSACYFDDCTHEPNAEGCAILAAVEAETIAATRYDSYLRLYEEAEA